MIEDMAGGAPPRLADEVQQDKQRQRQQQQQQRQAEGRPTPEGGNGSSSSGNGSISASSSEQQRRKQQQQQRQKGQQEQEEELEETKFELLEGLWQPTLLLPRAAKEYVTLCGTAAGSVSAVVEATSGGGGSAVAVGGAFAFGFALGYVLAPKWKVTYELALREDPGGGGGSGGGSGGSSGGAGSASVDAAAKGVYWRPRLTDAAPPRQRANAAAGAAAALYAALGLWLLSDGSLWG